MNFAEDFLPLFAACYLYNYYTGTTPLNQVKANGTRSEAGISPHLLR